MPWMAQRDAACHGWHTPSQSLILAVTLTLTSTLTVILRLIEVPSPQSDPQGIGIMSAMISEVRPTSPGRPRSVSAARRQRTAFPNGEDEL